MSFIHVYVVYTCLCRLYMFMSFIHVYVVYTCLCLIIQIGVAHYNKI
jgi:hypothetical protein